MQFRYKNILITIFSLIAINTHLFAQNKDIFFEQITNESGRSLGFITDIAQDDIGFMWFSTRNGLYRYNGYSYKLFKNSKKDSLSIPYNNITYLYHDNDNNLWMCNYDELSLFKDEKRLYNIDSITSKKYDIDVKIVQDAQNNYWIAPTGTGIVKYNKKTNKTVTYSCPPKTYTPQAWRLYDSILNKQTNIAQIKNPGNNTDTTVHFSIDKKGYYLIASSGEADSYDKYDFGSLYNSNNKLIWELSSENSMWDGGFKKNIFEAKPIILKKGNYYLKYKSDISNSCKQREEPAPDKINFCGIAITQITEKEYDLINSKYLTPFKYPNFIESELIKDILIDNAGNFWALTEKGLEQYNYENNNFEHLHIDFSKLLGTDINKEYLLIYQDKHSIFWIGSMYGLIRFDYKNNEFKVFQNNNTEQPLTSNTIYSIFEDSDSRIWIGTDKGLNIYNQKQNKIQKITASNKNRLYDNHIINIFEDHSKNIWVATFKGLNRLIKTPFIFSQLDIDANNKFPAIYDKSSNIWYAQNNRISVFSRNTTQTKHYVLPNNLFNTNEFTGDVDYVITDIIKDDNYIWVSTDNKISRFNLFKNKIDYTVTAGAIIVGTDSVKNSVKKLIFNSSNKKLYALCPNGLYIIDTKRLKLNNFISFNIDYKFIYEVDQRFFKNAMISADGNIWIRTSVGFYLYKQNTKTLKQIYTFSNEFSKGPLSEGDFDFDSNGNIYFATLPFLNLLDKKTFEVKQWQVTEEQEDWGSADVKATNKYIYMYGANGLFIFDKENKTFNYKSIDDGFIDNNINGIEEDSSNNLWLTSLKGLIKYNIKENRIKNFFTSSDFTTYQFLGNPQDFKTVTSEKIFFTTTGFISFYPDSTNTTIPNIVVDKFTIKGKDFKLDSLIYYKKTINLKYNQNFLGFEFAALDYTNPSENRYKYKLEGLETEWNITDATNRRANYSGISPGKYTLKVIGSNSNGIWNEKGIEINIAIKPPWYKTILAYILYVLSISIFIWLYIRHREQKLIEEKRILEKKVQERTVEIEKQKESLALQNKIIEEKNKDITDSIQYAKKIQEAILPHPEQIKDVVNDYFILYRPRDIVSGDYYWITHRDDITIIVAADCTGHGVPGAFMSMLGIAFLNEIVNKEGVIESNEILNRLRQQVVNQLHQKGEEGNSKDGMDVSLYVINHKTMKLSFSGAYNPLFIIRDNELIQLKADRMPIGYYLKMDTPFTIENFDLQKGDCLYNSSDGYPDQFGGPEGKKFMTKRFKKLLLDIHKKPMAEQRDILDKTIDEWRQDIEQIDDIIVIGVRV
jgi:ligand-binding sensor domain-containing protein/serine phosphatase RsbU (regulator of sigma subunit)